MSIDVADVFVVPPLDSENVVYSTGYGRTPGRCRVCGDEAAPASRIYCTRRHKRAANRGRRRTPDYRPRFADAGVGVCPVCGKTFKPKFSATCTDELCRIVMHGRGFRNFKRRVKWPHKLVWLAPKIGRAADDPLLPRLAVALALKGKLVVYVRADGTVGEVGRPKPEDE